MLIGNFLSGFCCFVIDSSLARELLVDQHDEANVRRDMNEIRHEAFIKTGHSFVPPCLLDAVPGAFVSVVLILKASADDLVGISGGGGNQLRNCSERQVFGGRLK